MRCASLRRVESLRIIVGKHTVKAVIASDVVKVRVTVSGDNLTVVQLARNRGDIVKPLAGVPEQRLFVTRNQKRSNFFAVTLFCNCKHIARQAIHLKPAKVVSDIHRLVLRIIRSWIFFLKTHRSLL